MNRFEKLFLKYVYKKQFMFILNQKDVFIVFEVYQTLN